MLSFVSSTSNAFAAPARVIRPTAAPAAASIRLANEMEPEEGWNVDNLTDMMDTASNSVAPTTFNGATFAAALPGATAPLGYFDPLNFCSAERDEETIRFLREVRFLRHISRAATLPHPSLPPPTFTLSRQVEIKHARVAMLAALGFPVAEQFHPLFASDDAPSYVAFQQTPLQTFWPVVVGVIAVAEVFSVFTFENPGTKLWGIRKDHVPGDLGFDPLGLKPSNAAALAEMQTKELNNGRLAMIAIAGMVGQELATGSKLF